ncbi:uncharacterized protein TNCV_2872091 [Trichonephila clavipes]|nr:uncharacterized protein TNCV_2872091 [Trichonephila clavipes]
MSKCPDSGGQSETRPLKEETLRKVSPSEQEEDERGPMPTSATKDLLKKWEAVRAMVFEWHPNQADVSRVGDLYNDNTINYFRKILKMREKQSTLDMFFNAPSLKFVGCPTHHREGSQICSIRDKSGGREGQGRIATWQRQSCDTLAREAEHCVVQKWLLGVVA